MSNLKASLLNTIKGVNASFDSALADLQQLVAEIDDAVKGASPELGALLIEREKDTTGVVYAVIVGRGDLSQVVAFYKIANNGYPIVTASSEDDFNYSYRKGIKKLTDKTDIAGHFQEMSENQNSPLIAAIAYLMRG